MDAEAPQSQGPNLSPSEQQDGQLPQFEAAYQENGSQPETPIAPSDTGEPTHLTSIDHSDSEGRWDEQKAATMAALLQEDRNTSSTLGHLGDAIVSQNAIRADPNHEDPLVNDLFEKSERTPQNLSAHITEVAKGVSREADKVMSPFIELYDLNPDKFAAMPTSDFMEIANKFAALTETIEQDTESEKRLQQWRNRFVESLAEGKEIVTDSNYRTDILGDITRVLRPDDDTLSAIDAREKDIYTGYFDKTPRQITQASSDFLADYLSQVSAAIAASKKSRQDIIDANRPSTV